MNLAYSLNHEVAVEKVVSDIRNLCGKISQDELKHSVLVISLQKILDYTGDSLIPKITYTETTDGK